MSVRGTNRLSSAAAVRQAPPPAEAPVGTLRFVYFSGKQNVFKIRPYRSDAWPKKYPSFNDAVLAAAQHSRTWGGVSYCVVKASDGAFQIRPLESENGKAFPLDRGTLAQLGVKEVFGTSTAEEFVAAVGKDTYIDLTTQRTEQGAQPLPKPGVAAAARARG